MENEMQNEQSSVVAEALDEAKVIKIVNSAITTHLKRLKLPDAEALAELVKQKLAPAEQTEEVSESAKLKAELESLRKTLEAEKATQRAKDVRMSITSALAGKVNPDAIDLAVGHLSANTKMLKDSVKFNVGGSEYETVEDAITAFLDSPSGKVLKMPVAEEKSSPAKAPARSVLPAGSPPSSVAGASIDDAAAAALKFIESFKTL
jgi:hypothetical protein